MYVTKVENKLGIRASDTATIVFEDCRIPLDNILGSAEVPKTSEGFKGVMATFDATRPIVAASAHRRRPRGARLRPRHAQGEAASRSATACRRTS